MKKLNINIENMDRSIPFYIKTPIWSSLLNYLQDRFSTHSIFGILDNQVDQIYHDQAATVLSSHSGFRGLYSFPAGEASKSRSQKERLEDLLLEQKAGRDSVLLAIGGGVTGDLGGYIAATLHRGIPLIHIPTSLIAQVDSSIGGKVGINHSCGKNLLGAFYQPEAVFCDVTFLQSLPEDEFINGMAEIIKYAVIIDEELWEWLESNTEQILGRDEAQLEKLVMRCAALKIDIVEKDEKESGQRSILNFGHTVGHAIEQLSHYRIKHGFAIAAGMKVAAKLSNKLLNYPPEHSARLNALLKRYRLEGVSLNTFSFDAIWECLQSDKKTRQQIPCFTLINADNKPELFYPVDRKVLEDVLT